MELKTFPRNTGISENKNVKGSVKLFWEYHQLLKKQLEEQGFETYELERNAHAFRANMQDQMVMLISDVIQQPAKYQQMLYAYHDQV